MPTNSCSLKQVRKHFSGKEVLGIPSLEFHPGTTCLILGGNGAGKSTLLRLTAQIIKPSYGSIIWDPPIDPTDRAYLGQQLGLYGWLSARETLKLQLSLSSCTTELSAILDQWGITPFASTPIRNLSQGQKVKVALARVLATKPSLVFLDEPTSHLDNAAVELLFSNLQHNSTHVTLIATHDLERCLPYATRILLLHEGQVVEDSNVLQASPAEITLKSASEQITARYYEMNR
jgi:ABC-type multidrug transport system ATPase subunit